jgi:hypothetical protein
VSFSLQGYTYLAKGIKAHDYGIEHYNQMGPAIEAFNITFPTIFTAET